MDNYRFEVSPDVGASLSNLLARHIETSPDHRTSFFATGGSQATTWYPTIASKWNSIISKNGALDLFLGDERLVPLESPDSNTRLINDLLMKKASGADITYFTPTLGQDTASLIAIEQLCGSSTLLANEDIEPYRKFLTSLINRYDELLEKTASNRFLHLGLGPDGHIASIFPNRTDFNIKGKFCEIGYDLAQVNKNLRLSVTMDFINSSKTVVLSVTGREKAKVLRKVLENPSDYPAGSLGALDLIILVDEDAASEFDL